MKQPLNLLLIEDNEDDAMLVIRNLRRGGLDVTFTRVETAEAMRTELSRGGWDAIISDFSLPGFSAPAALDVLKSSAADIPFIIVSGTVGEETAVAALKAGAHDFISKQKLDRLVPALEREIGDAVMRHENRTLEQQLRQAQKMEAVGRLAGGIAHDFNNILTAIQGYASLLLRDLDADSQQYQDVEEILSAAARASSFTRPLLSFSRNQLTQPERIDLNELVAGMHKLLGRMIGDAHELTLELGEPPAVFVDRGQLSQVIMNLVVNARDAMPHGGLIRIRTAARTQPVGAASGEPVRRPATQALIEVVDEGHGMSPDIVEHIFEPFFTTKDPGKGTGLGLSTVYGIVSQLGGGIEVHSRPERGSRFAVFLPEAQGPARLAAALSPPFAVAAAAAEERPPVTVLVVEDEPQILQLLRRTLTRAGFLVLTAANGQTALPLLEASHGVDLLLTDMMLPDTNGVHLIEAARRLRPGIRTLLMSGFAGGELELPDDSGFIEKPFTPDALTARVRELLRSCTA